jgi:broad specificity phosphatase PhoE
VEIKSQEDEDLDGFVLFSQPTYERVISQRAPDDDTPLSQAHLNDDDDEDNVEPISASGFPNAAPSYDTNEYNNALEVGAARIADQAAALVTGVPSSRLGGTGAAPLATTTDGKASAMGIDRSTNQKEDYRDGISSHLAASQPPVAPTSTGGGGGSGNDNIHNDGNNLFLPGTLNNAHSHTPAVHSVDRVQLNSGGPSGVFPIFRSKKDCKTIYIIRHGESEYNRAIGAMGSRWEDPMIYDAPLTMRGKRQAMNLREQVIKWNLPEDVVWVTSPLSRAIETMLLAFPQNGGLGGGVLCNDILGGGGGGPSLSSILNNTNDNNFNSNNDEIGSMNDTLSITPFRNVHVLPEVSEQLLTSGDIGHRPKDLIKRFPQLHAQLSQLPDCWWYNQPDKCNCAYSGQFNAAEPKPEMQKRIKEFRKWILNRPEQTFVAVGHSIFWKAFATACKNGVKQEGLKNCSWMQLHV